MGLRGLAEAVVFPRVGLDHARLSRVLAGKTVLITGASFGIGEELTRIVAAAGARVVLVARTADKLEAVAAQARAGGGEAVVIPADMTNEDEVAALTARLAETPPDIVVSNAGKSIRRSLFASLDRFHDVTRTNGVNFLGPVRLALATIPGLIERKGQFINVSAANALILPAPNWAAYQASKTAFDQWLRCAAPELRAKGVGVSTVYLPLVRTRMIAPTAHYADVPAMRPEDAARLVARMMITRARWWTPWWLPPAHMASSLMRGPWEVITQVQQGAVQRKAESNP